MSSSQAARSGALLGATVMTDMGSHLSMKVQAGRWRVRAVRWTSSSAVVGPARGREVVEALGELARGEDPRSVVRRHA